MFIAMNRFRVKRGSEEAFEHVWLNRDSQLHKVPGFLEFHLLKGPEAEDHTLYASHTIWQSKSAFEAWTKSEAFRAAHARAGNETTGPLYLKHPKFEGFEVRQTVTRTEAAVASIIWPAATRTVPNLLRSRLSGAQLRASPTDPGVENVVALGAGRIPPGASRL